MNDAYFASLARQLSERAARATISDRTPSHDAFREHLRHRFELPPGEEGSFLGDPVFEALFEYEAQDKTIENVGLLHPRLIESLDNPPGEHFARRFPKSLYPYKHQVAAWNSLKAEPARSAIVSTGTASGKTECFLLPILDDLVREYERVQRQLVGVRALFLYPLNALINSQRERLAAWTAGMEGAIRFCLYNGATPTQVQAAKEAAHPEQVLSRKSLWASPPPILVTNATMLEYMLVRNSDLPIIEQSRGQLRWIVLDEAHTYLGSNAAEVALLLRRVMAAFGADPHDVHFVATSATIGGDDATDELSQYLADLAGIDTDQVDVIGGHRVTPELDELPGTDLPVPTSAELEELTGYAERRSRLAASPAIRNLRHELTEKALSASDIQQRLETENLNDTMAILDYCSEKSASDNNIKPLLPLRGHYFMRTQPGVWACWNNRCSGRSEETLNMDWPFGAVHFAHRERCRHCDSLVFEVVICKDCGEVYLSAEEDDRQRLCSPPWSQETADDFEIDIEEEDEEEAAPAAQSLRQLICTHSGNDYTDAISHYHREDGSLESESSDTVAIRLATRHVPGNQLRCVTCGVPDSSKWQQFRSVRVGAPFYLGVAIPTFLAHTPASDNQSRRRPLDGRQMITFTDSRQGTAKFASRMEFESQRNFVRSFIYHKLWSKAETTSQEAVDELRDTVEKLKAVGGLETLVEEKTEQLKQQEHNLNNPIAIIKWNQLISDLENTPPIKWFIRDATLLRYSVAPTVPREIARMFLFREFARRPKSGNSIETLGLASIHFPRLMSVAPPPEWTNRGETSQSWHAYLKICIDYFIRGSYCSSIPEELLRWMGLPFRSKWLVGPDEDISSREIKRWPTIRNALRMDQRLIELLRLSLGLNIESAEDQRLIDGLLRRAWSDLFNARIFDSSEEGNQLRFEESEIHLVTQSYRCPVTQRLVDTVINGVSPYHNERSYGALGPATPVDMPHLPFPFRRSRNDDHPIPKGEIEEWLHEDQRVCRARQLGVWTEFSDRIAELYEYFETAEHSGQLSKSRLEGLEKRFREGKTNLLSCSTTMEMGIDIGGLTSVAMNNAPPGPANWLQRAGRAGRRDIARSSTLTLCQNQPHGQAVFENTLWPFETPVQVPKVALNSARIVQRHAQAFLLGRFLEDLGTDNAIRLTNVWMFHKDDGTPTIADHFTTWLETDAESDEAVQRGIRQVIRRSILESESLRLILDTTAESIRNVDEQWTEQRTAMVEELLQAGGAIEDNRQAQPEQRALEIQLRRLDEEYLLKELAVGGFLPAHGFPLNVLPFVNTSIEQKIVEQQQREESREDNGFQRRSYPTRELAMALREYAPGNKVIIDGLSYLSSGLTLHWQVPPTDEGFREPQAILGYWWCEQCGFSKSSALKPNCCESCGHFPLKGKSYIKPSGFAVDIRTGRPNSNEEESVFVPPTEPRLTCRGEWVAMPDPTIGSFRCDPEGKVFHHSKGSTEFGYAICLRCGRAGSETGQASEGAAVPFTRDGQHTRLRSGRKADNSHICPGSEGQFAIKRNLWLGGEETTDIFQLRLRHPNKTGAIDENAAVSIAIALRIALSRHLGVEDREIGWAVQSNKEAGIGYRDIYLYDVAAGGAGYVASAADHLDTILRGAREIVTCDCDQACHACLLDFSTQRHADHLDRNAALEWLDDEFFGFLQVPQEYCVFDKATHHESRSVVEGMSLAMQSRALSGVSVFMGGDEESWDVDSWPLWRKLEQLSDSQVPVRIAIPQSARRTLPWPTLHSLVTNATVRNISVEVFPDEQGKLRNGFIAGAIEFTRDSKSQSITWAVFDDTTLTPGTGWGIGSPDWPTVKSQSFQTQYDGVELTRAMVENERPEGCTQRLVSSELDGSITGVGDRFWNLLQDSSPWLKECLESGQPSEIIYTDRYIRTPLHVRVLYELLRRFSQGTSSAPVNLKVETCAASSRLHGRFFHDNWKKEHDQKGVIQNLLEGLFSLQVSIQGHNHLLRHARLMSLSWPSGRKVDINMDQGVGFFRTPNPVPHNFSLSAKLQASQSREAEFSVQHSGRDMPIYVIRREEKE